MTASKTWLEFIFGIVFGVVLVLASFTLMPLLGIPLSSWTTGIAAAVSVVFVVIFQYLVEIRRRA